MTTANLMRYILVVFRPGGEHMVLATSDCYEDLQYHQTIHGLQGFTQIINSWNFRVPRQNGKQANLAGERVINQSLEEVANERTNTNQNK